MDKENDYLMGFKNKKGKWIKLILDEIALERAKDNKKSQDK